jgi:hypothetical protein
VNRPAAQLYFRFSRALNYLDIVESSHDLFSSTRDIRAKFEFELQL